MKRLLNEATDFREEMISGYVAAYGRYLRRVPGASGVMAVGAPAQGKVAVIVGGGSGHYPAFYGLVGEGLASAAVIGEVFTSPSAEHAYRVANAVDGGAGVLFCFGNYSGDVLNFGMAETRLRAQGLDARTVLVTDDVLSAPKDEAEKRRGIAGGFYVFKSAGAAAARGENLDGVEAIARRANERVRTVGVAFAGCTIPGQDEPLFTVDSGRMEIGLGIHGEPGVQSSELMSARETAALMVDAILADAPADAGSRVAVLVNGLGSTKYEELFVLYQGIAPLLSAEGLELHEPQIGEFVTSLDMAGCSLTLFWLDDELVKVHDAYADTPAFTRIGSMYGASYSAPVPARDSRTAVRPELVPDASPSPVEEGNPGRAGEIARAALVAAFDAIQAAEAELGRLDAAVGDGDHGAGMARGLRAAVGVVKGFEGTARQTLVQAGTAFMDNAGGASGALVGGWLSEMGLALPADDERIDAAAIGRALAVGLEAVQQLGQAKPGDKTMIDTLDPFVRGFEEGVASGEGVVTSWTRALLAAEAGMRATAGMVSMRGRASRLGERTRGHVDAGATSMYYMLRATGDTISDLKSV